MEAMSGAMALHLLGILCAHEGRYEEAEEAFLRAVEADPEMAGSYVELGLVYACRGEYGKMLGALARAAEDLPGGVRAYLMERPLGGLTPAGSRAAPGRAPDDLEHDGAGTHALLTSATSLLGEGRDGEAAVMLEQSLEGKPAGRPAVTAVLALTYLLRGENVEADGAGVRRVPAAADGSARDR
jgi:tetratricopeptide (TPR) repeat protein